MSAPNTNLEKQAKRHRGPLTGMAMAVIWAVVLLAGLIIFLAVRGGAPEEGAESQVDGRTGATSGEAGESGAGAPATDDVGSTGATTAPDPAAPTVPAESVAEPGTTTPSTADTDIEATESAVPAQEPPAGGVDLEATEPGPSDEATEPGSLEN